MFEGIARISLVIGESHSLKDKRMVLRRIKHGARERASVTLNEVGEQDSWRAAGSAQIVAIAKDIHRFSAVAEPFVAVDDRTGAGDKAQSAQGDWIPNEWREEAQT
ncbi:hypothetical protein BH11MYX1_BH11MYX1_26560 [soil metagenome]